MNQVESYSSKPIFQWGESLISKQPIQMGTLPSSTFLDRYVSPSISVGPMMELQQEITRFEPEMLQELEVVNQRLVQSGKAPIDPVAMTRKIEEIANDPRLSDKEKRAAMNELRKQSGLSKGEMKKFFTKRLERIYSKFVETLRSRGVSETDPLLQKAQQQQKLYSSMYKPGGCVKKIFKGIGSVFSGIVKEAFQKIKFVINPKNWLKPEFWKNFILPLAMEFIPGLGPAAAFAQSMISKVGPKIINGIGKAKSYLDLAVDSETR